MRSVHIVFCLLGVSCLLPVCRAQEEPAALPAARPNRIEPLTRTRAGQILADTDSIGNDVDRQIRTLRSPLEAAAIEDISDVMAHASEWRWYTRDRGILLAIPVRERLGILARADGEKVLADVVRRLINQRGWGNPPVRVVLVEPEDPPKIIRAEAWQQTTGSSGYAIAAPTLCECQ